MDFYNYAASYLSVEVTYGGDTYTSAEFFVDGYAFLSPTVTSSGDFTIGSGGESVLCEGDVMYFTLNDPYNTNIVWYKDGIPIPGQSGQTLTVTEPGEYYVDGAPAQCPNYIQGPGVGLTVVACEPIKVPSLRENNKIAFYPNPVSDKLNFYQNNSMKNVGYILLDNSGRQVKSGKIGDAASIDFSDIKNGIYFLQLENNPDVKYKICKTATR